MIVKILLTRGTNFYNGYHYIINFQILKYLTNLLYDQAQNDNTLELPSSTSHRDSEHTTLGVNVCLSRSLHRARGDVLISCLCCRVRSVTERTSSMFLLRFYLVHFVDSIVFYIIFLIFILSWHERQIRMLWCFLIKKPSWTQLKYFPFNKQSIWTSQQAMPALLFVSFPNAVCGAGSASIQIFNFVFTKNKKALFGGGETKF